MSDDEYYYDQYEYLEWEGDPYSVTVCRLTTENSTLEPMHINWAKDDLAEHTMHSPVWVSYDPDFDTISYESDWEYYSDEFFDDEGPLTGTKRKIGEEHETKVDRKSKESGVRKKRRNGNPTKTIPNLSLDAPTAVPCPTVIWTPRSQRLQPAALPVLKVGQGEKVALLKDWREKFKIQTRDSPKETQKAEYHGASLLSMEDDAAEGFVNSLPTHDDATTPPPTTLAEETTPPSKHPFHHSHVNGINPPQHNPELPVHLSPSAGFQTRKQNLPPFPPNPTQPDPDPSLPESASAAPVLVQGAVQSLKPNLGLHPTLHLNNTPDSQSGCNGTTEPRTSKRKADVLSEQTDEGAKKKKTSIGSQMIGEDDGTVPVIQSKGRERSRGRGRAE